MNDEDDIDWDAFAILSADPEIDMATAYAASIRDEPPGGPDEPPTGCQWSALIAVIFAIIVAVFVLVMI
jgi:hypothetical protein